MKQFAFFAVLSGSILLTSCSKEPSVSFSASSTEVAAGQVVNFTNSSTDAYDMIWDFGDGSSSVVNSPSHVYMDTGVYVVTLQATDEKEKELYTSTTTITVTQNEYDNLSSEWQDQREAMTLELVGKTWDRSTVVTTNNSAATDNDTYEVEFVDDNTLVITDEDGVTEEGYWNFVSEDYISYNGVIYEIDLGSRVTLTRTDYYEIGGTAYTVVTVHTFK